MHHTTGPQPDDSNGAVPISGSSDYAYGYDVMMAKEDLRRAGLRSGDRESWTGIPWYRLSSLERLTA